MTPGRTYALKRSLRDRCALFGFTLALLAQHAGADEALWNRLGIETNLVVLMTCSPLSSSTMAIYLWPDERNGRTHSVGNDSCQVSGVTKTLDADAHRRAFNPPAVVG